MIIHPLHDLTNKYVTGILYKTLAQIQDVNLQPNYHPDFACMPGNLFHILQEGRFRYNSGTYYVVEEDGELISSAGWNDYPTEHRTALVLTRMYVTPAWRGKYTVGKYILPVTLGESLRYNNRLWMTFNEHNKRFVRWFDQKKQGRVPTLYSQFNPVGTRQIYYTDQVVYEYVKNF